MAMLVEVEDGNVEAIIVKNMSHLELDYPKTSQAIKCFANQRHGSAEL